LYKLVVLRISGVDYRFFASSSFLKVCFCRLGGNRCKIESKKAWRAKTLCPQTCKRPPTAHHLTPRHFTSTSHPTTPDLCVPTPTSRTLHPPLAPSTPQHYTPASHPYPPHGVPENYVQLCSRNIPLRQTSTRPDCCVAFRSVNPQPWHFTNNSLSLPHAHFLSVCLFLSVCVVCVCFLLYLSFYLCFASCVFCVTILFHIHNHLFQDPNIYLYPY